MAGVWRNGDLNDMISRLGRIDERLREQVTFAMLDTVSRAADDMRRYIEEAETRTGLERVGASSGVPGRIETGEMWGGISESVQAGINTIEGVFGWEDPEDYFLYQENGTRHLEAMHALLQSFIEAREEMKRRLDTIRIGDLL